VKDDAWKDDASQRRFVQMCYNMLRIRMSVDGTLSIPGLERA